MPEQDSNYNFLTREIIGNKPRWIVRWGITGIFFILLSVGITLSLIKYPVSASVPVTIEYNLKPIPLVAPANSVVRTVTDAATSVQQGDSIMLLENIADHSRLSIAAPVTGKLFLSDKYQANGFIGVDQVLGFVVPMPNEHVIKLKLDAGRFKKLYVGQKVIVRINSLPAADADLAGIVDFISPAFQDDTFTATIKLGPALSDRLMEDRTLNTLQTIPATASLTIDTISYLKYIFRGIHN